MYSVALMMALTTTPATPDCCGGHGGGCGCYGGGYGGGYCGCGYQSYCGCGYQQSYCGCCSYSPCYSYSYCGCCGYGQANGKGQAAGKGQAPEGKGQTPKGGSGDDDDDASLRNGRAIIKVKLPADAKLFVDSSATKQTSNVRKFRTPALKAGKKYSYTLTAEIVRDGQKVTTTKEVSVSRGHESEINLQFPTVTARK